MTWLDVRLKHWSHLSAEVQEKSAGITTCAQMFPLFSRTMECYAGVIRSKMRSEDEGDSPRRT